VSTKLFMGCMLKLYALVSEYINWNWYKHETSNFDRLSSDITLFINYKKKFT